MSELSESLEKSVEFLKERYPSDHPLLTSLERKLEDLKARKRKSSNGTFFVDRPLD